MRTALVICLLALGSAAACGGHKSPQGAPPKTSSAPTRAPKSPSPEQPSQPPATTAIAGHTRLATESERQVVERLSRDAERIRGLAFKRPVEVWVQDAPAMKQFVREHIDEEDLERARQRYVLLDLLPADLDIRPLLLDVMEEQLVGYYDPKRGTLAIRDDVARNLSGSAALDDKLMFQAVILHELVHALQDQHFDLNHRLEESRSNDATAAFDALVEGDATLAMVAYVSELAGANLEALLQRPTLLRQMLGEGMGTDGPKLGRAPVIVREPLLFSYRDGARFVAELVRRGGWAMVDAALRAPPTSTGHILWPQRHLDPKPPAKSPARDPHFGSQDAVEVVEQEVLGPFELGIWLSEHGGEAAWAKAWVADRLWQLRVDDQVALVWVVRFRDSQSAKNMASVARRLTFLHVERQKARLIILRGVAAPLAAQVRDALL